MPHSGLSAQAHPLPLLLKLYPASLPPTSKKQKKAAKQESFQQNGYAKNWVKPLRQAQVEREQSIRPSKSGSSRSHTHAAAILAFLPISLPHQMVWLPKPSKKSSNAEKSISAIGAAVRTDREIVGLYGKPCGTIGGTFRIPSRSNTPSYRQQVRALFRYISSSRFSCGYFGMHSYIFTSICTAARGRLLGLCTLSRTALPHPQLLHSCFARSALSYTRLLSTISPCHLNEYGFSIKFSRRFTPTPNEYFHSSGCLLYKYAIWSISGCPIRCRSRLYPDEKTKNPYKRRKLLSYAKEFPWL